MSDTPETDAKACRTTFSDGFHSVESCPADKGSWVDIDFARKLERERNEARRELQAAHMQIDLDKKSDEERDQLRKVADELAKECLECHELCSYSALQHYNSLHHVIERNKAR